MASEEPAIWRQCDCGGVSVCLYVCGQWGSRAALLSKLSESLSKELVRHVRRPHLLRIHTRAHEHTVHTAADATAQMQSISGRRSHMDSTTSHSLSANSSNVYCSLQQMCDNIPCLNIWCQIWKCLESQQHFKRTLIISVNVSVLAKTLNGSGKVLSNCRKHEIDWLCLSNSSKISRFCKFILSYTFVKYFFITLI